VTSPLCRAGNIVSQVGFDRVASGYGRPVTSEVIPDRATAYGERVRRRLTDEMTIWLTTVGRDGTPQPNPVGFLWDGGDSLLTYNQAEAKRLGNIRRQPLVSLHFDSDGGGGDIVVFTGTAEILDDYPPVPDNSAWLEKYSEEIAARFGDVVKFAETYSVPVRIHLTHVRGF
jgi:PPOX class probable F420-dependent enzyme